MASDDRQRDLERYVAHFLRHQGGKRPSVGSSHHSHLAQAWIPSVDVYETDDAVFILLELAGVEADKTEVHAEPHALIVRGVRRERHASNQPRAYHALEIPYGRFERVVRLPSGTDTSAAEASYRDGLLEITVPKRQPRQVKITLHDQAALDTAVNE